MYLAAMRERRVMVLKKDFDLLATRLAIGTPVHDHETFTNLRFSVRHVLHRRS